MGAPTSVALSLDYDEYSKFEPARDTIGVTWVASGGGNMSGQVLRFKLIKARRLRDSVAYQTDVTIAGTTDPQTGILSIHLPDVLDANSFSAIRRGDYFITCTAVSAPSVTATTADFPISIITAYELKRGSLFGLDLTANAVFSVKFQPQQITGVTVESASPAHPLIFVPLTYVYNSSTSPVMRQLSWGGGPLVDITAPGRYILKFDCTGTEHIIVKVSSLAALPTQSKVEELLVDKLVIADDIIRKWINQACDWWENDKVSVFLEPTRLLTDPVLPGAITPDYDFIVPKITFYPVVPSRWVEIYFPYPGLLKINQLWGQIANTRIVDIDTNWMEISERSGLTQLVPFNQQIAFQYIGLVWVESLRGVIELPNFWHFDVTAGLRQVDPVIIEILSKKAAIDALIQAGHAYRRGLSAQSISRDGVSESVSYTASATYGTFGATIEQFNMFINREIRNLKCRYRGLNVMVC